jgi:hypothetical protein
MPFTISNVLLVIAILLFVSAALQPTLIPDAVSLFDLGVGFVAAAFLFQSKPA